MAIACLLLLVLFVAGMAAPNAEIFENTAHYLPAHTLIETLSVIISLMVFATAWRSGNWERVNRLPLLGGAFLAVALLDTMHALSYPGMPDFITPNSPEKSIDFWLAGRLVAIGSLLALAWMRPTRPSKQVQRQVLLSTMAGIAVSALVLYIVIDHEHALPRTFIPGTGLTGTKVLIEYALAGMGLVAFARFARLATTRREPFHAWLGTAALAFALSELFFTRYSDVSDLMNLEGHVFKAFGCLAIYLAFFSLHGNRPWWSLGARLRLFAIILVAAFVIEYLIMLALPYLVPEGGSVIFEAVIDASSMAVLGSITVIIAIGRTQLRAMRAEYALDHALDGYCLINAEGRFIDVNASLCRMLGYPSKALTGIDIFSLEADGLDEENRLDIPRLVEVGHTTYATQLRSRQGDIIDLEISANHLPGAHSFALFLQDITALKRFEQQVDDLAYYDQITHLPNRRQLMERLETVLRHSAETRQFCALLAVNLDDFKQLNHAKGTGIGDEYLIATAKQLVSHVRDSDTVARIGGDEFVVILDNLGKTAETALSESRRMAQRLGKAIRTPTQLGDHGEISYQGSACIGITLFADQHETAEALLRQALIAMHQAKGSHHDAIRYYSEDMQRLVSERVELTEELRSAIKINALELHYQPQVDHRDRIIGAEALLRWHHPDKGLLSPASFITLAEETGLIVPLGHLVLHHACRQLRAWQDQIGPDFALSVNVSAAQFNDRNFVSAVKGELDASGVAPRMLKLELTESMLAEDTHQVIRQMRDLAGLGISFSMDDFGTGYSSLSYLTSLPLSQLKIDQGFVRGIDTNANHVAVVRTIINMGQALDLHVIAEGVETEAELELLKQNGCRTYQGFLFSRPLPAKAFTALLRQGKIAQPQRA